MNLAKDSSDLNTRLIVQTLHVTAIGGALHTQATAHPYCLLHIPILQLTSNERNLQYLGGSHFGFSIKKRVRLGNDPT